jgi:hypothetical protein
MNMKSLSKIALAASVITTLALGASEADAGVKVGIVVGAPVVKLKVGNPCSKPYRFRPAYCAYPVYGQPLFVEGVWYRGPVRVRTIKGTRYFWFRGRWERERMEWRG